MSLTEQREGIEAGRLDMFVDGAFALTLTLLVIGGDVVPNSTAKLLEVLGGIPAFAACFFQIAMFWHGHVRRRRLCLTNDLTGRWLSLLLVFFALIFVYPLHMVFSSAFHGISHWFPSTFETSTAADMRTLFVCYGLSFACMAGTLVLFFATLGVVPRRRALASWIRAARRCCGAYRWRSVCCPRWWRSCCRCRLRAVGGACRASCTS